MSNKMWTDRSVVCVVTAPEGWHPSSEWSIPPEFTDAKTVAKVLPLEDARAMTRSLNKTFFAKRAANKEIWDRQWAVCLCCPRAKGFDRFIRIASANLGKEVGHVATN